MSRKRTYLTAADRQKAYRARLAARQAEGSTPPPPTKQRRPPSRPARLVALADGVRDLQLEYQEWLDSLPESLEGSSQAEKAREAIEQLEAAADLLDEVQPPLGFGRD